MTVIATGCSECHPILTASPRPLHDRHYGATWAPTARVFLGGEEIEGVAEVDTRAGWALIYDLPPRPCFCGSGRAKAFRDEQPGYSVEIDERGQQIVTMLAGESEAVAESVVRVMGEAVGP